MREGPLHEMIDLSYRSRVLLAGDVHGMFDKLQDALAGVGYEPECDTLIMLGDLADRGPDSMRMVEWARETVVLRVLGNHDIMPRMILRGEINGRTAVKWGAAWFLDLPDEQMEDIATRLEDAPAAMTVLTPGGRRIGLVHADCGRDWDVHVSRLEDRSHRSHDKAVRLSLWDRDTVDAMDQALAAGKEPRCTMKGIDHVFHGHTPATRAFSCGDRSWLDSGACYGGPLTVIDADAWLDDLPSHQILA